jgi:Kef-type K+ transport system membrane component KefB
MFAPIFSVLIGFKVDLTSFANLKVLLTSLVTLIAPSLLKIIIERQQGKVASSEA